jgi:hypothetical protein
LTSRFSREDEGILLLHGTRYSHMDSSHTDFCDRRCPAILTCVGLRPNLEVTSVTSNVFALIRKATSYSCISVPSQVLDWFVNGV